MFGDQAATAFRGTWTDHVTAFFNYARGLATNDTAARDDARAQLVKFEIGPRRLLLGRLAGAAPAGRGPQRPHRARRPPPPTGRRVRRPRLRPRRRRLPHGLLPRVRHRAGAGGHAAAARPGGAAQPAVVAAAVGAGPAARRAHRAGRRHAARRGDREPGLPGRGGEPRTRTPTTSPPRWARSSGPPPGSSSWRCGPTTSTRSSGTPAASGGHDDAGRQAALDKLRGFEGKLAAFLDTATGSRIPSADLASAFLHHDEMLTQQVDAMANKDYARRTSWPTPPTRTCSGSPSSCRTAFGETVAARLPQGGAETGAGGTAGVPGTDEVAARRTRGAGRDGRGVLGGRRGGAAPARAAARSRRRP